MYLQSENNKYLVGVYARLSVELDEEQSNSIRIQIELAQAYIEKYNNMEIIDYYIDCGKTGTNFERESFKRMLRDIDVGRINCIIVKDLSRLGRNYIETGNYIEKIFPLMKVRFVAINDNYDSEKCCYDTSYIEVNLKNLVYDLYSKDISKKVRSSIDIRKSQGNYLGANSPFGYEKSINNKYELVVTEDESKIVKRIFELTLLGYTSVDIARMFNKEKIKTPIEFKIEKGMTKRAPKGDNFVWNNNIICQILKNEVYVGKLIYDKYEKDMRTGKKHLKPYREWKVINNHHKAIMDENAFYKAQKLIKNNKRTNKGNERKSHILVGKVVCASCKKNLTFKNLKTPYYTCNNRYTNCLENCVERIDVEILEGKVIDIIKEKLKNDKEFAKLYKIYLQSLEAEIKELLKAQKKLYLKLAKLRETNRSNYEKYVLNCADIFNSQKELMQVAEMELLSITKKIKNKQYLYNRYKTEKEMKSILEKGGFYQKSIEAYIDKIVVFDEYNIEILWK